MTYNRETAKTFIEKTFDESVIPSLCDFVRIPNLSRAFDPEYATNGLLQKAGKHLQQWTQQLGLKGLKTEFMQPGDLTPLLFIQIQGQIKDKTILFYGHFDKQPYMTGWDEARGPTSAIYENDKIYGRGVNDDGYALYAAMLAVKANQEQGIPLPRILMISEGDEESGSHIEEYLKLLKDRLGNLDLIFVLDSDAYDYERLWITKSIRGVISCLLTIKTISEGVHSGQSSGIIPSVFKIFNIIMSRLQDLNTGKVNPIFNIDIPADRYQECYNRAKAFGMKSFQEIPIINGVQFTSNDPLELLIQKSWKPQLTVTGLKGLPPVSSAGNVMLPQMTFRLSLRIPPTYDSTKGAAHLTELLTKDPPFGAKVTVSDVDIGNGWSAAPYNTWLEQSIQNTSKDIWGKEALSLLEGGSIPVVNSIGQTWPNCQIIVTGAAGPNSGAHGPNEHLYIPYTKQLVQSVSAILAQSSKNYSAQSNE